LELDDETWSALSPNQRADIQWLESNDEIQKEYDCDSHVLLRWPPNHPSHSHGEWLHAFYIKLFGWVEFFEMKGIAVVVL
jgi:hypothetical protein